MKTTTATAVQVLEYTRFKSIERYYLRSIHPRAIIFDLMGWIWSFYFLWEKEWVNAVIAWTMLKGISLLATLEVDPEKMARSRLGKVALLSVNPMNMATRWFGFVNFIYGLWFHSFPLLLTGVSLFLLGWIAGWGNVDRRFRDRNT